MLCGKACKILTAGSQMLGISTIDFWYTNGYSAGLGLIRITTERFVKTIFTTCMRRVHWENAVGLTSPVLCYVDEGGFPVLIEYPLVLLSVEAMDVKGLSLHQIGKKSFIMVHDAFSFPFVTQNRYWLGILVFLLEPILITEHSFILSHY